MTAAAVGATGRARRIARQVLLVGICLAFLTIGQGATAQQDLRGREELDPVTEKILKDALIQLRFVALSLETEDEVGQALEGIVRALLARGKLKEAIEETQRIDNDLWHARALRAIAVFQAKNGESASSQAYLRQAAKRVDTNKHPLRAGHVLRLIAIDQAKFGDLEEAIRTTGLIPGDLGEAVKTSGRIPSVMTRLETLQQAAQEFRQGKQLDEKAQEAAATVLREAFSQATKLKGHSDELVNIFIEISRTQVDSGDRAGANRTLRHIRDRVLGGNTTRRSRAMARIASAFTYAGNQPASMDVLRRIPEGGNRAVALSSVARSLGQTNKTGAALPMFILAKEQTQLEENKARRQKIYSLIIQDEATIGRLADAFNTAGKIEDRQAQARALMGMGKILLAQEKYKEAEVLLEYIPYVSMRAPIIAGLTKYYAENRMSEKGAKMLATALEPTGFDPVIELLPNALRSVLAMHLQYGKPEYDTQVFTQTRDLIRAMPEDLTQVNALTYLATAEAARDMQDNANKTIGNAWTLAWLNKQDKDYPLALANIAQSQIAVGDILSAFDTAARLPAPEGEDRDDRAPDGSFRAPKYDALTSVAVAAAKLQETDLALRAARQIRHPAARAAALAAVAVATASPQQSLRKIIGIGPTDKYAYNVLSLPDLEKKVVTEDEILEPQPLQDIIETDGASPS